MTALGVITFADPKPPEYLEHLRREAEGEEHEVGVVSLGACIKRFTCHQCGISWETDTSG